MKKVFIVILNFNGSESTIACLESINKLKVNHEIKIEIIVVDNASIDGSVEKISKQFKDVILIENKINMGFSGGCNEGARMAIKSGADYVAFLNNDTIVDKDLIETLIKTAEDTNAGGVVPKIYFQKGYEFHKDKYKSSDLGNIIWYAGGEMDWDNLIGKNIGVDEVDKGQFDIRQETELATGCCFMVRAEVLEKVGLFDDRYFLYYEDADLTQRIKRAGRKIIYEPSAILWHKNADSSGGSGSDLQDYYITRNRLLFGLRYAPVRTKAALLKESAVLLTSGRKWQKKGVRDYYLRKFGRGSFPI